MSNARLSAMCRVGRVASALLLSATLLAACGGGGGGGGGSSPPPPPPAPAGGFTMSTSALNFAAKWFSTPAAPQSILVTLSDSTSAAVGAAYKPGISPASWLTVTVTGTAPQYSFAFFANTTTQLPPGTYSTTVTIGTADANGNILQTRDVAVTYTLREGLVITSPAPAVTGVAGSSLSAPTFNVQVQAPAGLQWVASASQSWLLPPAGTKSGPGNYTVGVDMSALAPGQLSANLTLTNVADPTDTATLGLSLNLTAPTLTTNVQSIGLGGESGFDGTPASLKFSLETGTRAHPWTLVASTTSGGNWLSVSSAAGDVSATETVVTVNADRSGLAAGTYSGELVLQTTVNGASLSRTLPVTLKVAANRLVLSSTGVAFSKFPSSAVLTRTLAVHNSADQPSVAWQATSSQPWLAATLSGTTGQPLVLTADPTGLLPGQYFAEVTVVPTDPLVVNNPPEKVRVGFAVRAADPPAQVDLPGVLASRTTPNPVEPEVFVIAGTAVSAYDMYSGTLLRTLPATTGTPQALAMSADGQSLYVAENEPSGTRVVERDPVSGAVRQTFTLQRPQIGLGFALAHARPDGHGVLLTSYETFDAATGVPFGSLLDSATSIASSSNQRYVYIQNSGRSSRMIERYELHYSTLAPVPLLARLVATNTGNEANYARENVGDIALSADDAVLYLANGYPYWFDRLAADTLLMLTPPLAGTPYPDNVETCWNGLVAAGADASQEPLGDLWIYDAAGAERARLDSGNDALFRQSVRFSGDCTRLVSGSASLRFHAVP